MTTEPSTPDPAADALATALQSVAWWGSRIDIPSVLAALEQQGWTLACRNPDAATANHAAAEPTGVCPGCDACGHQPCHGGCRTYIDVNACERHACDDEDACGETYSQLPPQLRRPSTHPGDKRAYWAVQRGES